VTSGAFGLDVSVKFPVKPVHDPGAAPGIQGAVSIRGTLTF